MENVIELISNSFRFAIDKTKNLAEFLHSIKLNAAINKNTSIFLYCNNALLMMRGIFYIFN